MNRKQIITDLENAVASMESIRSTLEKKLEKAPEGSLCTHEVRGFTGYYKRIGKKLQYLGKNENAEIKALEQKAYDMAMMKSAEVNAKAYRKAVEIIETADDIDETYNSIKPEKRHLINPYLTGEQANISRTVKEWRSHAESFMGMSNIDGKLFTSNGEQVRSKSELIIAEKLKAAGIPYTYEEALWLDMDGAVKPDFTVMNMRTGQKFIWEHLGRMGDDSYAKNNIERMETYAKHGYFPGVNMIITFESAEKQLSTLYVDMVINQYLK